MTQHKRFILRMFKKDKKSRRSEAGNVFFTLFGAVAVVGVLGAGIMSTMRGPLSTMVEINRIEEAKAQLRLNARLILQDAVNGSSAPYCGTDDDTADPGSIEFVEPVGHASGGGPTGGGLMPSVGGTITDPWGQTYGYCAYNNGADTSTSCGGESYIAGGTSLNNIALVLISSGPDRTFDTTCAQGAANNKQDDDLIEALTYTDAVSGSGGLWADSGTVIASDKALNVTDTTTDSTFGAGASFGGNVSLAASAVMEADIIQGVGTGSTVSVLDNIDIQGNITNANATDPVTITDSDGLDVTGPTTITNTLTISGTNATTLGGVLDVTGDVTGGSDNILTINDGLTVTGATDLEGALNVNGSITDDGDNLVTIDDGVNVTGAADFDSTVNIGGNISDDGDNVVTIDDGLEVTGTSTLQGPLTINSDGNTSATDAFVINDSGSSEVFAIDDAGNISASGDLILATVTDDYILVANGSSFKSVAMDGDITIDNGTTSIADDAVLTTHIKDGEIATADVADDAITAAKINDGEVDIEELAATASGGDLCLKSYGTTGLKFETCSGSGGGDGVGLTATGEDECIVSYMTGGGTFAWNNVDCSTLTASEADRIVDTDGDTYIDVDTTDDGLTNTIVMTAHDGSNSYEAMKVTPTDTEIIFTPVPTVITDTGSASYFSMLSDQNAGADSRRRTFLIRSDSNATTTTEAASRLLLHNTMRETGAFNNYKRDNAIESQHSAQDNSEATTSRIVMRQETTGTDHTAITGSILFETRGTDSSATYFADPRMKIGPEGNVVIGDSLGIDSSAILELDRTDMGFLPPRVSDPVADISSPATGLIAYDSTDDELQVYNGTEWVAFSGGNSEGGLWAEDGSNDYIEYDDTLGGVRIGRVTGQPAPAIDWQLDVTNSAVYTTTNKVAIGSSTVSAGVELDVTGNIAATQYCDADGGNCFDYGDITGATASVSNLEDSDGDTGLVFYESEGTSPFTDLYSISNDMLTFYVNDSTKTAKVRAALYGGGTDSRNGYISVVRASGITGAEALFRSMTDTGEDLAAFGANGTYNDIQNFKGRDLFFSNAPDDVPGNLVNNVVMTSGGNVVIKNAVTSADSDASAILQADSATQGFLPPRMDGTARAAISSPADGLVVYDTDDDTLYVYDNDDTLWRALASSGSSVGTDIITDADGNTKIQVEESADDNTIRFDRSGAQVMVLTGNAGASGNNNVEMILYNNNATSYNRMQFKHAGGQIWGYVGYDGTNMGIITNNSKPIQFSPNSTQAMIIDTDGDIGIGDSSITDPVSPLQIADTNYTFAEGALSFGDGDTGVYESADDALSFDIAGNENMKLSSTGLDVNNATGDPLISMDFSGNVNAHTAILFDNVGANRDAAIEWESSSGTSRAKIVGDAGASGASAGLSLQAGDGNSVLRLSEMSIDTEDTAAVDLAYTVDKSTSGDDWGVLIQKTDTNSTGTSRLIEGQTDGTEMFYIDDAGETYIAGNVGIKNASPDVELDVTGDIEFSGTITDVSDRRLKTDIQSLDRKAMLASVMDIDTYQFRMKDDTKGRIEYGVMAQELEHIFPNLVRTANDEMGTKSVNYMGLIAPLIETSKHLKDENDALKSELDTLNKKHETVLASLDKINNDIAGLKMHTGYKISKASNLHMMLAFVFIGLISIFGFLATRPHKEST